MNMIIIYDYSQTFSYKQITEKIAQSRVPSFYDIWKLICLKLWMILIFFALGFDSSEG